MRGWRTAANDNDDKVREALAGTAETEEAEDDNAGFGEALGDATKTRLLMTMVLLIVRLDIFLVFLSVYHDFHW